MPTRGEASPSSAASSASLSSSATSAPTSERGGVDISGYRLIGVVAFVVFTFGLFLYLQHDALMNAEDFLEMHSPPTIQNFVRKTARSPSDFSAKEQDSQQQQAQQQQRWQAPVGGVAASARADSGAVVDGGFVPRRFRSAAAAEMAARATHGSLGSDTGNSIINNNNNNNNNKNNNGNTHKNNNHKPNSSSGGNSVLGFIEVDLVEDEGADLGNIDRATAEDCAKACLGMPGCHSFSYRCEHARSL